MMHLVCLGWKLAPKMVSVHGKEQTLVLSSDGGVSGKHGHQVFRYVSAAYNGCAGWPFRIFTTTLLDRSVIPQHDD